MSKFAHTSCSQCGQDTGPGDAGHSTCASHSAPDLSGFYPHEFVTASGLAIRCYLDYEAGERSNYDEPGHPASMTLEYAFVGLIDICEVLSEEWVMEIEGEALESLQVDATESRTDARIAAAMDNMAARVHQNRMAA